MEFLLYKGKKNLIHLVASAYNSGTQVARAERFFESEESLSSTFVLSQPELQGETLYLSHKINDNQKIRMFFLIFWGKNTT